MERRGFAWAGVVFVLVALAYVVPYTLLSGVDRWYGSFIFWMAFGLGAFAGSRSQPIEFAVAARR
jgi:hypothetical protein